jgi:polyisoprenoid-binding protein YceI
MRTANPTLLAVTLIALVSGASRAAAVAVDNIDTNHSTVGFSIPILGGLSEVEGKFTEFKVAIQYDENDVTHSSVEATVMAASIDTGIPDRDKDLRGAGFFNVTVFPEIRFVSSSIQRRGDGFVARGNLTLHGVTRPVEIPFALQVRKEAGKLLLSVRGDVTLNRDDYGISWRHPVKDFVSDQVSIRVRLISKLIPLPAAK